MLALCRALVRLYPAAYRCEFGEEMLDVLSQVEAKTRKKSALARVWCVTHEAGGLLYGALREHFWSMTGSYDHGIFLSRRFAMRSEFRFPKATVALMTVILAAVVFTIEKAKAISASIPHANTPVGHIQPVEFAIVPSLLAALISALVVGVAGWSILFALRRSGIQRISEMNASAGPRADN